MTSSIYISREETADRYGRGTLIINVRFLRQEKQSFSLVVNKLHFCSYLFSLSLSLSYNWLLWITTTRALIIGLIFDFRKRFVSFSIFQSEIFLIINGEYLIRISRGIIYKKLVWNALLRNFTIFPFPGNIFISLHTYSNRSFFLKLHFFFLLFNISNRITFIQLEIKRNLSAA